MPTTGPQKHFHQLFATQAWDSGYFALIMATGIISIAAHQQNFDLAANILLIFNVAAYSIGWVLVFIMFINSFNSIKKDFCTHSNGPGYFTWIAATSILGSQLYLLYGMHQLAILFWILAVFLWFIIQYSFFAAMTISRNNPGMEKGINGTWLVSVVATQSLPVLGTLIARHITGITQDILILFMIMLFFAGSLLYIILITIIFYRLTFLPMQPSQLQAPYWINMGAVAISTLAGSMLVPLMDHSPFLQFTLFVKALVLFFWSIATWWIPLLLILGLWRHIVKKVPLPWTFRGYHPSYWGLIFPLGMYTVCTYEMIKMLHLTFLKNIPQYFIFLAFAGWIFTFTGMVDSSIKSLKIKK